MNTSTAAATIDLSQRPKTYFWPLGLETQLLTHIKGAARRAVLQRFINQGRLDELPEYLAREAKPAQTASPRSAASGRRDTP